MRLPAHPSSRSPRRAARLVLAATAIAAATSLTVPAAHAAPASKSVGPKSIGNVDKRVLDTMGVFAPAIIGAVTTPGPDGKVNAGLIRQARSLATAPGVPADATKIWNTVMDFVGTPGEKKLIAQQKAAGTKVVPEADTKKYTRKKAESDPVIPTGPNAPKIQEFLYPTIGIGCMGLSDGFTASLGRALTTAGPQEAPAPGPKTGEAGYVYTALGTGPAVKNPAQKLWVSWLNIDTGRNGQTELKRNERINVADGPGTFTGIARTGKGRVISTIHGTVTTTSKGKVASCGIAPTIGLAII
ncbi:hypothetical protein GII33_15630 [Gordonia pseudamarae]|uniref:Secreted protein n=1 Tax=Gordonia pseudamarae TaxID=2831662 RepID=A0ABX6ILQ9_9ACTN|nr:MULTISPECIES: hypothetical protein [Gordonia]MBD0023029.1 hypothetical protein [Gordonia sp. (in: high G+C Gram-positive bacteria)]QHN27166.1 hypothetical protein GII33_15630 [Gordonia pseudamarae]QHN36056.1 hypothetical protein GII31_15455 [Gordonia pseudamarae]